MSLILLFINSFRLLKVGLTGGIGSGKSVVGHIFEALGIPVFKADDAARYLMEYDEELRKGIITLLGSAAYDNGVLNRKYVSDIIYRDPGKLQMLNGLVHPATIEYGQQWITRQKTPYVVKEAAIFFESGSNREMDIMVGIYAPAELRISRTMKRGDMSREKVLEIMGRQMDDDAKMKLCDYVITNDNKTAVTPQVLRLHDIFTAKEK